VAPPALSLLATLPTRSELLSPCLQSDNTPLLLVVQSGSGARTTMSRQEPSVQATRRDPRVLPGADRLM
jgi:hypothetical protein